MPKSAKEVITDSIFNAMVDALTALRKENVDMALLREIKAMHSNTTFGDLPECVKRALHNATELTLVKLNSEGYGITTVS